MFEESVTSLRNYIQDRTNGECTPPWNWLFIKLASLLSRYPSGITKAIILAEIQQSWNQHSQFQGLLEEQKARKVSVESVFESRRIGYESILEAVVENIETVPGTHTKIAILRDPARGRNSLGMHLHQKLYHLNESRVKKLTLRFTSCRLIQRKSLSLSSASHKVHLLPSENVVILSQQDELSQFGLFGSLEGINESPYPHYGHNIKVEVADLGFEEAVHFPNGQTSNKRCVKVVDSEDVHVNLYLWDEQLPLANLFKEGDILAIQQPFVVPNQDELFFLEYGPATVIFCMSHAPEREIIPSQDSCTQGAPVSVIRDSQGMLDYSTFPERVFLRDIKSNMTRVTVFCTITKVNAMEVFSRQQVAGHKFTITVTDATDSYTVTIYDHNRSYHDSLFASQNVLLENACTPDASSLKSLTLKTNNGGRIWNLSAMTGWLATKYFSSPVPVKDVVKFYHCVCQAVVIQVHGIRGRHAVRAHMSCHSEVESNCGYFLCKNCKVTHLNETLNKPHQLKSPSMYWKWQYTLSLELHDSDKSVSLTDIAAEQLLQITASQFVEHVANAQEQVLESVLGQECLFGISSFQGHYQINAICLIN
ncbi:uncharacterized protein LOC111333359 [Stylophora pistillata]|uniref:Uncharacterized protein n=1 Tax=Stylophora pistillata TaxID=50429 RepID=A0A2B4S135_STYPI|nr:uncharacterized protein LOC111333359 [Stylophora pistillata]PFX23126.1 hypothetical protein AWC38_SpisGene12322 [Stylophora pistillata]